jgi:hypothetical protein
MTIAAPLVTALVGECLVVYLGLPWWSVAMVDLGAFLLVVAAIAGLLNRRKSR